MGCIGEGIHGHGHQENNFDQWRLRSIKRTEMCFKQKKYDTSWS